MAMKHEEIAGRLHEVIAALDRRTPRVDDAAEADIAREAATLRRDAVDRLAELSDQATCLCSGTATGIL